MFQNSFRKKQVIPLRVAICDDNGTFARALRERLSDYCCRFDIDCDCEIYTSPTELSKADLSTLQILFLDVDMPQMTGIDVAHQLRETLPDLLIIYVTAWIKYAPYGYQVAAFRYLLKQNLDQEFTPCMDAVMEKLHLNTDEIALTGKEGTFSMAISHILYFEGASGRRFYLHTAGNQKSVVECVGKLTELEKEIDSKGFLRIQRSFLINMQHIKQIHNYEVLLSSGEALKVSKPLFNQVKADYALWRASRI